MKLSLEDDNVNGYVGYCTAPSEKNPNGLIAALKSTGGWGFEYIDKDLKPSASYDKVFCGSNKTETITKALKANREVHRFGSKEEFIAHFFSSNHDPDCCVNAETEEAILVLQNEGHFISIINRNKGNVSANWMRSWWSSNVVCTHHDHRHKVDWQHVHYALLQDYKRQQEEATAITKLSKVVEQTDHRKTQQKLENQSLKSTGETAMGDNNTFNTRHFLGSDNLADMTDRQVIGRVKQIEDEIGKLKGMKAKSTKRDKMIKRLEKDVKKALKIVDARKAQ
ncbi:hypothetical protein KAT92_05060 [Candidatus Babeliales bacterium]|nr:hypothetical protein [Candidatus Babeliales bacterium]